VNLANIVKRKVSNLSRRYQAALRAHLKQRTRANLQLAKGLGRQAMAKGLETLDHKAVKGNDFEVIVPTGPDEGPRAKK
jgi:hypothetical protein